MYKNQHLLVHKFFSTHVSLFEKHGFQTIVNTEPAVIYNILHTSSYLRIESPVKAPQRLLKEQDYVREFFR